MAGAALSQARAMSTDFVTGAHFIQVKYRFRGRRSAFARSGDRFTDRSSTDLVAGAAFSRGGLDAVDHLRAAGPQADHRVHARSTDR